MQYKSTSSSYLILVPFSIFRENFMKNIKKPPTTDALYLDELYVVLKFHHLFDGVKLSVKVFEVSQTSKHS